jgi:hypothetical protein
MDCLKGYIGLSVQGGTAESNLYACTLPGISMHNCSSQYQPCRCQQNGGNSLP